MTLLDANCKLEDVATDRIADLDGNSCVWQLAGVSRIPEVV